METITTGTIVRTVLLVLALVNQLLCVMGISPIPIDDEVLTQAITTGATIIIAVVTWWKNNSFTQAAIIADKEMHSIKDAKI